MLLRASQNADDGQLGDAKLLKFEATLPTKMQGSPPRLHGDNYKDHCESFRTLQIVAMMYCLRR